MPSRKKQQDEVEEEPPTSINPYEVLSLEKDATDEEVKKAYRRAALKHHPDKAAGDAKATAHETFQKVAFAYAILSDPSRRKRYDATGSTSESVLDDTDFDWQDFFRAKFEEINAESIQEFAEKYRNSEEERGHILEAYSKSKGNMDAIYESVMLSNVLEDDDRFRAIIDEAITKDEVKAYDRYTNETQKSKDRRIRKAQEEAKEAEEAKNESAEKNKKGAAKASKEGKGSKSKSGDLDALAALIQQKNKGRGDNFLDRIAEKYAEPSTRSSKKRGRAMEEPPEEAFVQMTERVEKAKRAKGKK